MHRQGQGGQAYEFGNKVSVAVTSRGGWLVGAKSFTANPYDGHTLAAQMRQLQSMIGDRVSQVHVDMGYRGHDYEGNATCMWTNEEEAERHGRCGDG